uniref:Uncharacterized protein n=1 Tax=Racemicystis crocea TaxID=1707966 RepID=A0A3S5GYN9_9BACT|nr:hypothetical protein [Racemicystis crocea]
MAKRAKQIDNRIVSSGKVVRAATTHKQQLAAALEARAIEVQGPSTKATAQFFEILFDFLGDTLDHSARKLGQAEDIVVGERADDVQLREDRGAAESDLIACSVRIRSSVADLKGNDAVKTYGLEGTQPRRGRELSIHARNVARLLKAKPFSETVDGVTYDSAGMAAALVARADKLDGLLTDLEREEHELGDALGKRDKVLTSWGDDYQGVADALTGLFRVGGRKDLSERVRPTTRVLSGDEEASDVEAQAPASEAQQT